MISIDINHPDVEEFIDCKTNLERVKYANISVRVNDKFMQAVKNDEDYILRWPCERYSLDSLGKGQIFVDEKKLPYNCLQKVDMRDVENNITFTSYVKRVKAKELFNKLVKNNWDYAEPGILYWDRIQGYNLLDNTDFKYAGTNPCAK